MAIAAREQRAGDLDGQVEGRAHGDVLTIEIPPRLVRRDRAKLPLRFRRHPNDAQEGPERDMYALFEHRIPFSPVRRQIPDFQRRRGELVGQEAEPHRACEDGGPAVRGGLEVEEIDLQNVAGFGAGDEDGADGRVGGAEVEGREAAGG